MMSVDRINKIREAFEQSGHRHTRQRQVIAERFIELAITGEVFAINALWHDLRQKEPNLGRSTLYRCVEMLVAVNLVDRIDFADGTHHYHVCKDSSHQHLTCVQCHHFVEVHMALPLEQFTKVSEQSQFLLEGLSLTLFGRCAKCRSSNF